MRERAERERQHEADHDSRDQRSLLRHGRFSRT